MTAIQKFRADVLVGEETSHQQRSILLVDIMNALGFSKREREIHIHHEHLRNVLMTIFRIADKCTITITGSIAEGMRGGIYCNQSHGDFDFLFTTRNIKLYTPRANNISNLPPLLLDYNEDYNASFFVEEDVNFPGYVKLSLAEVKTNCANLVHCTKMNDDKLYLPNSVVMDS